MYSLFWDTVLYKHFPYFSEYESWWTGNSIANMFGFTRTPPIRYRWPRVFARGVAAWTYAGCRCCPHCCTAGCAAEWSANERLIRSWRHNDEEERITLNERSGRLQKCRSAATKRSLKFGQLHLKLLSKEKSEKSKAAAAKLLSENWDTWERKCRNRDREMIRAMGCKCLQPRL